MATRTRSGQEYRTGIISQTSRIHVNMQRAPASCTLSGYPRSFGHECLNFYTSDTGMQRMQLARAIATGETSKMISRTQAEDARPVPNIKTCRTNQPSIHGCYLKSNGADYIWTTSTTSRLVLDDSYSKYLCIRLAQAMTATVPIDLLEEEFAPFGLPPFWFEKCCSLAIRGILGLVQLITHRAPSLVSSRDEGAAERVVQTFKQTLKEVKSATEDAFRCSIQPRTLTQAALTCC